MQKVQADNIGETMITGKKQYQETIEKELGKKLNKKNLMQVPHLVKIVINMGVKDAVLDKKNIERAMVAMEAITGQHPRVARAKKSIASFKVRQGDAIGLVVTLRGERMYAFFTKMVNVVFPRTKDFHGVRRTCFDQQGNFTLGLSEYSVFPEIDPANVERAQGMEICFVTTSTSKEEGLALLEALGMPFEKA